MGMGRPTIYSEELAEKICETIATHTIGIQKLCRMYDFMPDPTTIFLWRIRHEDFSQRYNKARLNQADLFAEECIDISDDSALDFIEDEDSGRTKCNNEYVNRSRLRIDTRKWVASKLLPKVYGDQKQIEQLQDNNIRLQQELNELRSQLAEKHKKDY